MCSRMGFAVRLISCEDSIYIMRSVDLIELHDDIYKILIEFDRVCRKNNIKYSLEGGTLLGAVKYGDFVPWDDDMDVIMLRGEYERFLKLAPAELNDSFFLQSYNNILDFPLPYAKLCYTDSRIYAYEYESIDSICHGVFIDIFPIDNVKPSTFVFQAKVVGVLRAARCKKLRIGGEHSCWWKALCYRVVSWLPMSFLCELTDKVCGFYNKRDTGYCYEICNPNFNFRPLPCDVYENHTRLPFRDGKYMAVSKYDEFLKSRFGENYTTEIPIEEKRKPSHQLAYIDKEG